jgi:hypothetical protein
MTFRDLDRRDVLKGAAAGALMAQGGALMLPGSVLAQATP